jgi:hypothetical protein
MNSQHKGKSRGDLRLCAAVIGSSALVAMAAIGLMVAQDHDAYTAATSTMNIGSTSTETTPPKGPAVAMAKPAMKGPAPLPSEENAAK